MNAVYFKGTWLQKFVISATKLRTFYLDDGTEKQVPTMAVTGMFLHGDLPDMEATFVQLPFKVNEFFIWKKRNSPIEKFRNTKISVLSKVQKRKNEESCLVLFV